MLGTAERNIDESRRSLKLLPRAGIPTDEENIEALLPGLSG